MNKRHLSRLVSIADRIHKRQQEIAVLAEQFENTIDAIAGELGLAVYDYHPELMRMSRHGASPRKARKNVSR